MCYNSLRSKGVFTPLESLRLSRGAGGIFSRIVAGEYDAVKEGIHPKYVECKVTCGCGVSFATRATRPEIHVEICSKCHPFYTGKQKFVDIAGRVEKFRRKYGLLPKEEPAEAVKVEEAEPSPQPDTPESQT